MKTSSCHVCGTPAHFLMKKEEYEVWNCGKCGLVYIDPQPTADFLKEKVYSQESGYQANKARDLSALRETPKQTRILNFLEASGAKGKLLDVGCSSGEFLYAAKKRGFETYGVELNKRTADIAKANGLNVVNGLLADAHFKAEFFDAIFLGDVIEHVPSPRELVAQCAKLLRHGGIIVISTPNLDCSWAKMTFALFKLLKIPWSCVTPPHHLFQFSFNNLTLLMDEAGFGAADVWYVKPPVLRYELGGLHLVRRYKRSRRLVDLAYLAVSFSLYALAYAVARVWSAIFKKDFSMVASYRRD